MSESEAERAWEKCAWEKWWGQEHGIDRMVRVSAHEAFLAGYAAGEKGGFEAGFKRGLAFAAAWAAEATVAEASYLRDVVNACSESERARTEAADRLDELNRGEREGNGYPDGGCNLE